MILARLEATAHQHGAHGLHFVDRRTDVTYAELAVRVRRTARALRAAGLARGDNVGLLLPTCPELYIALLGAQRAGLAPSPFAPPASASRIDDDVRTYARALRAGRCRALLVDRATSARLGPALDRLEVPILEVEALEATDHRVELPAIEPGDLALVQYTSGSTSHPKGVALTHAQLAAGIDAIALGIALTAADVNGQWLPVHHDMGLIGSLVGICCATEQYLWSPLTFVRDPARWLSQFAARKATIFAGPSFAYAALLARVDDEQLAGLDLSAWRIGLNGAEPVDVDVLERFAARFARAGLRREVLMPVYGLAEITLAATFPARGSGPRSCHIDERAQGPGARVQPGGRRVASVGAAVAGHELRIRHRGATLPDGTIGEIQLRGPAVMTGYDHDPAATAAAFEDGWLRTGDLGFVRDGELHVTGRVKEMMILHGRNYYPHDVEELVQTLPGCHRGMAVAFAGSDNSGEHMVVVAETRLSDPQACAELARAAQREVRARLSIPRLEVVLVRPGAVPRTSSGKRQRLLMRERAAQRAFQESVVWSTGAVR